MFLLKTRQSFNKTRLMMPPYLGIDLNSVITLSDARGRRVLEVKWGGGGVYIHLRYAEK